MAEMPELARHHTLRIAVEIDGSRWSAESRYPHSENAELQRDAMLRAMQDVMLGIVKRIAP